MSWENRAERVIASMCLTAYREANRGKKKHVPYCVPEAASDLVRCLGTGNEIEAKQIMLGYDVVNHERNTRRPKK